MLSKQKLVLVNFIIHLLMSGVLFVVLLFFVHPAQSWYLNVFIALNFSALVLFGYDKLVSGNNVATRLPELFFYLIAAFGASTGIFLGAFLFRHKTQEPKFILTVGLILLVQSGLTLLLLGEF